MTERSELIRVRGLVQGVGFRPTTWRLAQRHGLRGWVANDGLGVRIHVCGPEAAVESFVLDLAGEPPPLARIERIEREPAPTLPPDSGFHIAASTASAVRTGVVPDAAACPDCVAEVFDPFARRYRYPFTNCTHCGPRHSIVRSVPYDRAGTTMAGFRLCAACAAEYDDPADRRFHAQPIACHACGPALSLVRADGRAIALEALTSLDAADAACTLLQRGHILAVQGLGGYQLACDATNADAVARLRAGKRREAKPFALMARSLAAIRVHVELDDTEAALLGSSAAPIVLLRRRPRSGATPGTAAPGTAAPGVATPGAVAESVAPGLDLLGFMLPNTPLHHLLLQRMERPIVLTSGNRSDEPQAIHRDDARQRLGAIAGYFLEHDRPIARRVDDSVTRVMSGRSRLLRRARGFAPATLPLPPGFESAPFVLGCGGELKNTFCLLREGGAVLSAHIGGLHDPLTRADRAAAVADFERFHEFAPAALACDLHPDYFSTQSARERSRRQRLPLVECQHHHAHLAACLAENGVPRDAPAVLGVVLDGTGYGADGTIWGGEFLRADYLRCERLGTFKPVAMLGGDAAIHEPWRSTYAHIMAQMGWAGFAQNYAGLELYRFLESRPRDLLDAMLARRINAPLASSCGRLFDAVAAALGLARERARFEGEGAMQLEAAADRAYLGAASGAPAARPPVYPFPIPRLAGGGLPYIEPLGMWAALFGDLVLGTPLGVMSARFHLGLADAIVRMVRLLTVATPGVATPLSTVALSGGVFQNRVLFEHVEAALRRDGFEVLSHAAVPCNDGGIALGQAVIAAARLMRHAAAPPAAHH